MPNISSSRTTACALCSDSSSGWTGPACLFESRAYAVGVAPDPILVREMKDKVSGFIYLFAGIKIKLSSANTIQPRPIENTSIGITHQWPTLYIGCLRKYR